MPDPVVPEVPRGEILADARGVAYGHAAGPELGFEAEGGEHAGPNQPGDAGAIVVAHGNAAAEAVDMNELQAAVDAAFDV